MATTLCLDGNEAAGRVAHRLSEVVAIYPITPASPMGEAGGHVECRRGAPTCGVTCPR